MIKTKAAIAAIFRQIAQRIEDNTCEVDDREFSWYNTYSRRY